MVGKHLCLAHGGDADPIHRAPCRQLLVRQGWAAVRRDVRPHLGLPVAKEGMQGLDILLQQGQIHDQGRGIELGYRCVNGLEDGTFHVYLRATRSTPGPRHCAQLSAVGMRPYSAYAMRLSLHDIWMPSAGR